MTITNQFSKMFGYFRQPRSTAKVAKERLQIIISHERIVRDQPDYLALLQRELLAVIAKYVAVDKDDIKIDFQNKEGCSILELNITLPSTTEEVKHTKVEKIEEMAY
jgi:cell division topological specificity factor